MYTTSLKLDQTSKCNIILFLMIIGFSISKINMYDTPISFSFSYFFLVMLNAGSPLQVVNSYCIQVVNQGNNTSKKLQNGRRY